MKDFGLVVIGAHFGVWLNDKILEYKNTNILLVEPVPYNYKILQNKFKEVKNIFICTKAVFSKNLKKKLLLCKRRVNSKIRKALGEWHRIF